MYKKSVRRRRLVLLALVATSLALLTAHYGESASGALHSIQRGFLEILAPLQEGASRALKPPRDLVNFIGDALDAKSENKHLKKDLEDARRQLAASQTAERENKQLRGLVNLDSSPTPGLTNHYVTARVIARSPTVWYSTLTIDKGSSSGIRRDQPVITGDGLVGRISATAPNAAQVMLITDHSSAVSAQAVPDGANGLIQPAVGNPDDLLLNYVQKGKAVKQGQLVVTAGWQAGTLKSLFPRGIPIGRITKADPGELEVYQRAHLKPFGDLRQIDVVQVIDRPLPRAAEQLGRFQP